MKALAYSGKQLPTQSPVPSAQEQAGTNPNFFSEQVQDKRWYAWDIVHSQKPMDTVQMDRIVDLICRDPTEILRIRSWMQATVSANNETIASDVQTGPDESEQVASVTPESGAQLLIKTS
jgi:hypothetical protein